MTKKVEIEEKEIEGPYELPEGWKWVRLGDVADFERGITFPASAKEHEKTENNIPCLRTANVQEIIDLENLIYISKDFMKNNPAKLVQQGDIIFSSANSRELVGKSSFIDNIPFQMTFGGFVLCIRALNQNSKFVFYFLRLHFLLGRFMGKSTQTTNIANINSESLAKVILPLPPLNSQLSIVNSIESLFSKLDQAKEKAQSVVENFESRKAAILHKAFTGELTANWRKENGVSDDTWEEKLFDSCISKMQNGLSKRFGNEGEETVVLRLANIGDNDFDISDLRTIKLTSKEQENYSLNKDDVVMIRVNGSKTNVGRQIMVKNNDGWSFCDHIIRIKFESSCMPNYMVYFSNTKEYKDYIQENMVSSAGQNTISRKGLSKLTLRVPSLPEQQEIVRILDTVLEKERIAKEVAEKVLEQIDLLKKSILARAFRGEL